MRGFQEALDARLALSSDSDSDTDSNTSVCPICLRHVHEPVTLNCGHIGCKACVDFYFVTSQKPPVCPVCQQQSTSMSTPDCRQLALPSPAPALIPCRRWSSHSRTKLLKSDSVLKQPTQELGSFAYGGRGYAGVAGQHGSAAETGS